MTEKVIVDIEKPKLLISKEEKSERAMVHKNKTEGYPVNTTCFILIYSAQIRAGKRCDFSWL